MASKLVLLLAVAAALAISFGCVADASAMPGGSSVADSSLPVAAPEFALASEPLSVCPTGCMPAASPPSFGDSSYPAGGISRPPLYPPRR